MEVLFICVSTIVCVTLMCFSYVIVNKPVKVEKKYPTDATTQGELDREREKNAPLTMDDMVKAVQDLIGGDE